ncbi:MAG: HAD family hydrolase [Trebonia sp.]
MLWDLDGTLLEAGGAGVDLYEMVFLQLFGRPLRAHAPMAGRTDRAIILETLEMAGISEPRRYVDPFIEGLRAHAHAVRETVACQGHALPGAASALAALATADGLGPPGGPASARTSARVHQSVLTGNIRTVAEIKLSALGLREALDLCIGAYGDDHEVRAELVPVARRRAAAVHGRLPTDFADGATIVIGDTPLDVEAALVTGARAVGVATGRYSVAELTAAGADVVLPDLTDTRLVLEALAPRTPASQGMSPQAVPSGMTPSHVG